MLCANMEAAERMLESALLITAAEIAPRPIVETKGGVRRASTIGRISDVFWQSSGVERLPSEMYPLILIGPK